VSVSVSGNARGMTAACAEAATKAPVKPSTNPAMTATGSHAWEASAWGGGGKISVREKVAYGHDKGVCEDGITLSLTDLAGEIAAAGQTYSMATKTIKDMHTAPKLRATQRKSITSKPGLGNKVPEAVSHLHNDLIGEQPKTWAHKVKDMRQAAAHVKPLVGLAANLQTASSRRAPRPSSAAGAACTLSAVSRRGDRARPSTAVSASWATKVGGGGGVRSRESVSGHARQGEQIETRAFGTSVASARASVASASASASSTLPPSCAPYVNGGYQEDEGDMYARDESIGVRPKSRRGRGTALA